MLVDLRTFLLQDTTIDGMVSDRMYPLDLPQKPPKVAYPALTYSQVSGVRVRSTLGPTGRARLRISINAWAKTYEDVRDLSAAVRRALDGFKGSMGGTVIDGVKLENELDLSEPDVQVFRVMQDYMISYVEG